MTELVVIDDPDDERVAAFRLNERGLSNRLQRRDDEGDGLFMAEGDLVVERALDAGCVPVLALVDSERPPAVASRLSEHVTLYAGGERLRAAITKLGMPYSVVALFERPPRPSADALAAAAMRLVLVEAVDNPVNIGSIARNALALGWDGLVVDATSADPLARRALRVSMGHALRLPHARVRDLPATIRSLRAGGWPVLALTPTSGAVALDEAGHAHDLAGGRVALVVGSERAGLSPASLEAATACVRIPMLGAVDSLNAAAATAIACWHLRRR